MIYYLLHYKTPICKYTNYGLMLSVVGDILLSLKGYTQFLVGTTFFFSAHIIYIAAFRIPNDRAPPKRTPNKLIYGLCAAIYLAACVSLWDMWSIMPDKVLFAPYGFVLSCMVCSALLRWMVLVGSILFAISDNTLATLKFKGIKTNWGKVVIMTTYYLAQYLIMHGAIRHNDTDSIEKVRK
jgi:alkenylglycerophosphocholine/alkenylglycerophosphoethanolamine hydrolase